VHAALVDMDRPTAEPVRLGSEHAEACVRLSAAAG
jgi:hypothetical protein